MNTKAQFEVIEKWTNADSLKERVIRDGFDSREEAALVASALNVARSFPWSVFVVQEVQGMTSNRAAVVAGAML